jgi:FkbM family methyltransferase
MLIYDVGMHNGDDTHYYLAKGATVVGIEANPNLGSKLQERFAKEIASGRLRLIVKGVGREAGTLPFYVAPGDKQQSSFVKRSGFTCVNVPVVTLSSIMRQHGEPDFLKIDVEHVDLEVLQDLSSNGIIPRHLSVEAHSFDVLLFLYRMNYTQFRLLNGKQIHHLFSDHRIVTPDGVRPYRFRLHSSGPFGEDLHSPWQTIEQVCAQWMVRQSAFGGGWFDVHATDVRVGSDKAVVRDGQLS